MKREEADSLAALYATWDTDALVDALRRRAAEFAPDALLLIEQELKRRDAPLEDAVPPHHRAAVPENAPEARQPSGRATAPTVQYVGAWGLWFLLNLGAVLFLGWALGGRRPRGPVEAIVPSVILLVVSFVTFRFAVKWLVVDDLTKKLKNPKEDEDTQHQRGR
jgi:hypothetical protein